MKREYEIGLIINPETADEEAEKIKTSITDILTKGNGSIENIDDWGRKALAYPIEKHNEGIYVFIKTLSPGDVIAAVERRLKLNEKVMRFIVIRLDDKLKKTNKLEKKWKRIERFSRKPESDRERPSGRPAPVTPKPAETVKKEAVKE
ncbi:MAG: 30S ribosomal protein S6, partial [Candidatus Aminicenantes bacterium]|nr:30S ribosomal protein S6 [Candidatus Aminicenantes bacterium]